LFSMPRLKVCCIGSTDEARLAIDLGASAIGLVSAMPSGPGVIPEHEIARIAATVAGQAETFLLTSETRAERIIAQHHRTGTTTLQLVDEVEEGCLPRLRRELPGVRLVQVIHVAGEDSVALARSVASMVDALLLDSGNPGAPVKELGGTGRVHDWSISREIVAAVPVPVFLAGGLRPDNVAQAVAEVGPYGLDVCSGVRTAGRLDPSKLSRFVAEMAMGRH